ncbi:hypothetical protein BABINDRAFT_161364 [Babjeviella inositovora NRRL Y-12698]|uniref:DNA-directed RNA polymerase I subunit RPA49 n=1 Tax=Babjeviella inositovora NRRL Y-12698 TaxID=984486 RepID=A0A1E3QRW3_9ASCO|nr:uncharacterized protein BABINDRAFT_161364 [Babjeviella inositovora NRRL Y-12698]ODQ80421.1 hypothetical protein BABINDRAFT_161364 [Babjeviella inositovora NRRL Y-12698]
MSIPESTDFQLYKHKSAAEFALHGENETLEYNGETASDDTNNYVVAMYDPVNKSVELYQTPMLLAKVTAKAKRFSTKPAIQQKNVRMMVQRNALGEAFGTKKAKKAITDQERNRVDAEKLSNVELDIVDAVKSSTLELPSRKELAQNVSNERPVPPCNADATNVEDVYAVESIIPAHEWEFLRVSPILKEKDAKKRAEMLPFATSAFVNAHLPAILSSSQTTKLQLLYYTSLLMGVYENRRTSNKDNLSEKLNNPPDVLVDGILDRFAIARPGAFGRSKDRGFVIDPQHEDKLLCYILCLVLHIDSFMVEISPLAQELSLKPSKLVNLFKTLGCGVKSATVAQADAYGIPKSAASTYKIASLRVPFKVPEMTRKGSKKGR